MPTVRAALLLAAASACVSATQAQTIWRCGDSYSRQPCPDGRPVTDTPAPPDAAARSQAAAASARDARMADTLEKERLRLEAQAPQPYVPPPRAEPAPEKHKWPEQAGTRKLDVFTATAPGSRPAKGHAKDGKTGATAKKAPPAKAPGRPVGPPARP